MRWLLPLLFLPLAGCQSGPAQTFQAVSFQDLGGFRYQAKEPLPLAVMKLKGAPVELTGFMLPIDFEGTTLRSFILTKDQNACCFGKMPALNQWVMVRVAPGSRAEVIMDHPICVRGHLEVGEECTDGVVASLYRAEAESIAVRE